MPPNDFASAEHRDAVLVYSTFPSLQVAEDIAATLVNERLIACANIVPGIVSVFIWEGQLQREAEVAMIMKTRRVLTARVIDAIREKHPYETPAIVVLPIEGGLPAFLGWVEEQTLPA